MNIKLSTVRHFTSLDSDAFSSSPNCSIAVHKLLFFCCAVKIFFIAICFWMMIFRAVDISSLWLQFHTQWRVKINKR